MTNPEVSEAGDSLFGTLAQGSTDFSKDGLIYIDKVEKKLQKSFIGAKKDSVVKVDIQKLFKEEKDLQEMTSLTEEEAKALMGEFEFTVKNVNRVTPAEMNQEFFDKIFGDGKIKSEEEFIAEYTKVFEENYEWFKRFLKGRFVNLNDYDIEDIIHELPFLKPIPNQLPIPDINLVGGVGV